MSPVDARCQIQEGVLLQTLSTFGIGGPADFFAEVVDVEELFFVLDFARRNSIPILPIGKGSNCLFADEGFRGVVIRLRIEEFEKSQEGRYTVGAGYSFPLLGRKSAQDGFSGLEFAAGIPASVGGAVFMNAGASGQETCQTLISVEVVDNQGVYKKYAVDELLFSYRFSSFQTTSDIIVRATFQTTPSEDVVERQKAQVEYRLKTQPYKDKSCGCIFRNPSNGPSSGKLIEESGLKGVSVGGAEVSSLHANFIVNRQGATAHDIRELIHKVQSGVASETGYHLKSEIRMYDQFGKIIDE